jgi:DNA-binding MltR family transcriptional regulator
MQKLIFIFFLTLGMLQLSAQENVFSYSITKNSVTKNAVKLLCKQSFVKSDNI